MVITLDCNQIWVAKQVARRRHEEAIAQRLKNAHGRRPSDIDPVDGDGLDCHEAGCCGRLGFSLGADVAWWMNINAFKSRPDLGRGFLVTRTRRDPNHQLLVRKSDCDLTAYIHVVWDDPDAICVGWMIGAEAKMAVKPRPFGGREEAFFIPDNKLRPMSELLELMMARPEGGPYVPKGFKLVGFGGQPMKV